MVKKPCRLPFLHVGLQFLGGEKSSALELRKRQLYFPGYLSLVVVEPLLLGVQCLQSPSDDFVGVLVSTCLHRFGDEFFTLGP
jgi:hypothetical protein